ncbi:1-acyl-sn-glycerol-3-phosphate acyltransferase [Gammaproteobacteria bacterium]|jgi:1-acyl-sn-glycerol-3-phosphate acyltransferase|nr:1-acyl-sn-glycerol-3-phosphate acyltransferase [Gammaproteobacteria bacterium]MDA9143452.1 1-acyl-sn-glycerol-3-phosphate acyltransferase [Gammaproteobacteria bacterium]MDC3302067.1 1-acyl-sn-glycerol-3-phosphate acyltransferase [Gammaproteobacteria bacterium]
MTKRKPTVSVNQIPHAFRAYRPKIVVFMGRLLLKVFGWKVEGMVPEMEKNENLVLIAAPHTSNWDGVFGFAAIIGLDAKISYFGKYTLFDQPILGRFLKYMGGIPVDKNNPGSGLVREAIANIEKLKGSLIAMAPEGTRSKTEQWRTGFLRIAEAVDAKIFVAAFDFNTKRIVLDKFFQPSENMQKDLDNLKAYYTQYGAKKPENF